MAEVLGPTHLLLNMRSLLGPTHTATTAELYISLVLMALRTARHSSPIAVADTQLLDLSL